MKTRLLIILCFGILSINAQTTYNLDWYTGIGSNVDLTIDIGDTVKWTWTSPNHTVTSLTGSVETFDSGTLGPVGSTYSYTFNLEGANPYYCEIHGISSMSGTITVQNSLGLENETFNNFKFFPNPSNSFIHFIFPQDIIEGNVSVIDILGKKLISKSLNDKNSLELDVSNLIQGIYFINVKSGTVSQTKQFVKN
jgi:hypothetical protein